MKRAYRIALTCWAFPLVCGLVIFGWWLYSQKHGRDLPMVSLAGVLDMLLGLILFPMGLASLVGFLLTGYRDPHLPRLRLWGRAALVALLLCSNFAVAAGIVAGVRRLERTRFNVYIWNNTAQTLPQVHLSGAGCDVDFGSIAPDGNVSHFFWVPGTGNLTVQTADPKVSPAVIPAVAPNQPGAVTIDFNPGGPDVNDELGRTIPEPSTYAAIAGITALGLALCRRRAKSVHVN